jgi:hypothetical protein
MASQSQAVIFFCTNPFKVIVSFPYFRVQSPNAISHYLIAGCRLKSCLQVNFIAATA